MKGMDALLQGIQIVTHTPRQTRSVVSRLAINSGTVGEKFPCHCYFPKNDWRCLNGAEASLLSGNGALYKSNFKASVVLFSISETLHSQFWELDIKKLFIQSNPSDQARDSQYRIFLAEMIDYLINDLGFSIAEECVCHVVVNKAGMISTRYSSEYNLYTGLDIERTPYKDINTTLIHLSRAYINLGDEVSYFFFINLPCIRIIEMLGCQQWPYNPHAASVLAKQFLSAFPNYPVIRLSVLPSEGILVPVANLIHDSGTLGKKEPEVILTIRACFAIEGG